MKISIIIPANNEKEFIEKTLTELKKIKIIEKIIIIVDNKPIFKFYNVIIFVKNVFLLYLKIFSVHKSSQLSY